MFWGRVQDYWLPFTSHTVRHRVPSGFNWTLTVTWMRPRIWAGLSNTCFVEQSSCSVTWQAMPQSGVIQRRSAVGILLYNQQHKAEHNYTVIKARYDQLATCESSEWAKTAIVFRLSAGPFDAWHKHLSACAVSVQRVTTQKHTCLNLIRLNVPSTSLSKLQNHNFCLFFGMGAKRGLSW